MMTLEQRAETRGIAVGYPLEQLFIGYCLHGSFRRFGNKDVREEKTLRRSSVIPNSCAG